MEDFNYNNYQPDSRYPDLDHNMLLREVPAHEHLIWRFGKNKNGELSQKDKKNILKPMPLKFGGIAWAHEIASGGNHTAIVDGEGRLWVCGNALVGKLGLPDITTADITTFRKCDFFYGERVVSVSCGEFHTMCL